MGVVHWFDGLSTLHKFTFTADGGVLYRNAKMAGDVEARIAALEAAWNEMTGPD